MQPSVGVALESARNKPLKMKIKLTANFERNLAEIERFLHEANAPQAFDALLDELLDKVLPNLERFPDLGTLFLDMPGGSVESLAARESLRKKAGATRIRQYVLRDYLILYAVAVKELYLLTIKHHRQLSFDLDAIWFSRTNGSNEAK